MIPIFKSEGIVLEPNLFIFIKSLCIFVRPIHYSNLLQCDGDGKFFRSCLRDHECKCTSCTLQPFTITRNDGYFVWNMQHWKRFCNSESFGASIQLVNVYSE